MGISPKSDTARAAVQVNRTLRATKPEAAIPFSPKTRSEQRAKSFADSQGGRQFQPQQLEDGERRAWTRRKAGKTAAFGGHIVPAEFAQSISDKFQCDFFAPGHVEIGVIERLGNFRSECRGLCDDLGIEFPADKNLPGFCGYKGTRSGGSDNNGGLIYGTRASESRGGGYGEHWEIERAAAPQLPVSAAPAVAIIDQYFGEKFVGTAGEIVQTAALVELRER